MKNFISQNTLFSYGYRKALKALNKISLLLSVTNGLNTRSCITLCKALVHPHLEYAFPVWVAAKEQGFVKIDRIQRMALSRATGCLISTPTAALEVITNVVPVSLRLQEIAAIEYIRFLRKNDNNPIRTIALYDQNSVTATSNPQLISPPQIMLCAIKPTAKRITLDNMDRDPIYCIILTYYVADPLNEYA